MKVQFSRIIAGVMRWGSWGANLSIDSISQLIEGCLELGVTTFDHADIYGDYKESNRFGQALIQSGVDRQKIQIISKCGIKMINPARPQHQIKSYDTSYQHIIDTVDQSLQDLQTDYLDLLLIHRPSPLLNPEIVAKAFSDLKDQGKVHAFGVSNFKPATFDMLNQFVPLYTNQVEASLFHLDSFEDGTFDQMLKLGKHPMVWAPFGAGKFPKETSFELNEQIDILATKYKCTHHQMLLAFLLNHPSSIQPIIGTSKLLRVKEAVDVLEIAISDEDWFRLWIASTGKDVN